MLTRAFALALAFAALSARAADSDGSFAVKGMGLTKCSQYVEVVEQQQADVLARYVGWVAGYLSASNQHQQQTFDVAPWQSLRTLAAALAQACKRNADLHFGAAVIALTNSMQSERLQAKAEPVAIGEGESKLYVYDAILRRMQEALTALGLYSGEVDGTFGDDTREALKAFQTQKNLDPSGVPDQRTLFELMRQAG